MIKGITRIDWIQENTWIGVFDILGFKNLLRKTDHDSHRGLLTSGLDDLIAVLKSEPLIGGLKYSIYSDTFVVYVPQLRKLRDFMWTCQRLMEKSVSVELPLRGAISFGSVFSSESPPIFLGTAFLEAHEYCEGQDWIGLLLTPSAIAELYKHGLDPLHLDFVSDEIPFKKGCSNKDVFAYRFQNGEASYSNPLLRDLEQMKHFAPDYAKHKYDKTITFIQKHYRYISAS